MPSTPPPKAGKTTGKRRIYRALVVDDHDDTRALYAEYLRERGWQVEDVRDGAEAIAVASVFAPDVIVMDVAMPEMDGLSATRYLKRDHRTTAIPVIVLTAHPAYQDASLRAGCAAFLVKPRTPDDVFEVVRNVVTPESA